MDPATIGGILLAFAMIFGSQVMEGGNPASIILIPPMMLVFGGTIGAAVAGGILRDATGMVSQLKRAMTGKPSEPGPLVEVMVKMAERARREGLLALEDAAKEIEHPFLRRGCC